MAKEPEIMEELSELEEADLEDENDEGAISENELEDMYAFDDPEEIQEEPPGDDDSAAEGDNATDTGEEDNAFDVLNEADGALLSQAAELGMTKEDFSQIGSVEELKNVVSILKSRNQESPDNNESGEDGPPQEQDLPFNEEEYEPEIVDTFKKLMKENSDLQQRLTRIEETSKIQREREGKEWFDKAISDFPEGWKDVFGEGSTDALDKKSEAFKNRSEVATEMRALIEGYSAIGHQTPPPGELLKRAVNSVFADKAKEITLNEIRGKLNRNSRNLHVRRRASGEGGNLDPETRAKHFAEKFYSERGINPGPSQDEEF